MVYQRNPLAIVVVTPLMQRAHLLPMAKDIVFVDSTASCNAENHTITFLLTLSAAGAIPLGIIITSGQTAENYKAGFELFLKSVVNPFKGCGFPVNFMTDESDAEREALRAVWGDSKLYLCHFHLSQAAWRWLRSKENKIEDGDRQSLYKSFRLIMISVSQEEANRNYAAALQPETAIKYPNWIKYLNKKWQKKEEWVLAWRDVSLHNNHTNNFCEASVRLFKDIVMGRNKAYNVVALTDYTSILLEDYYVRRLRRFAHSRCDKPRLVLNHKLSKAAYLKMEDIRPNFETSTFDVPSAANPNLFYSVDLKFGSCTCPSGLFGGFCKHQAAVFLYFEGTSSSTPGVTAAARYEMAVLAFGEAAQPAEFYKPLQHTSSLTNYLSCTKDTEVVATHEVSPVRYETEVPAVNENEATDDDMSAFLEAQRKCHQTFGTSASVLRRITKRLNDVRTRTAWETFLCTAGAHSLHGKKIRVQPTSISRRRDGVTRGSKRIPSGRPPSGEKLRKKRKRNLHENVSKNRDNAKSH